MKKRDLKPVVQNGNVLNLSSVAVIHFLDLYGLKAFIEAPAISAVQICEKGLRGSEPPPPRPQVCPCAQGGALGTGASVHALVYTRLSPSRAQLALPWQLGMPCRLLNLG